MTAVARDRGTPLIRAEIITVRVVPEITRAG